MSWHPLRPDPVEGILWTLHDLYHDFKAWLIAQTTPIPKRPRMSDTLRSKLTAKAGADNTLADAQAKLSTDLQVINDDQKAVKDATDAVASAASGIAADIGALSPNTGEVVDPVPDSNGNYTVYKLDQSTNLYHTYTLPSLDSPLPTASVVPPAEPATPGA